MKPKDKNEKILTATNPFKFFFWGNQQRETSKTKTLELAQTDAQIKKIIDLIKSCGFSIYEKGGSVRNRIANKLFKQFNAPINDYDVVTNAHPDEILAILQRAYPTAAIISQKHPIVRVFLENGLTLDISTFRANLGKLNSEGQIIENNSFGNLNTDYKWCDYTINSIYFNPCATEHNIIYFGSAYSDLEAQKLRIPEDPISRIIADPIIILRGIRFANTYGFSFDDNTYEAICKNSHCINKANTQHISHEIDKILFNGHGKKGFEWLKQFDLLKYLFPQILKCKNANFCNQIFVLFDYLDKTFDHNDIKNKAAIFYAFILWPKLQAKILSKPINQFEIIFDKVINKQNKLCTISSKIRNGIRQHWRAWIQNKEQATDVLIDQIAENKDINSNVTTLRI